MKTNEIIERRNKVIGELEDLKKQAVEELKSVMSKNNTDEVLLVPYYDELGYDTLCVTDKHERGIDQNAEVYSIRVKDNFVTIRTEYHDCLPIDELNLWECVCLLVETLDYIQDQNIL